MYHVLCTVYHFSSVPRRGFGRWLFEALAGHSVRFLLSKPPPTREGQIEHPDPTFPRLGPRGSGRKNWNPPGPSPIKEEPFVHSIPCFEGVWLQVCNEKEGCPLIQFQSKWEPRSLRGKDFLPRRFGPFPGHWDLNLGWHESKPERFSQVPPSQLPSPSSQGPQWRQDEL